MRRVNAKNGDVKKAVVLLSGGMDSATTLAVAKRQGFELYAISFRYGQKNDLEVGRAGRIARCFGVRKHLVVDLDLRKIGGSALTSSLPVPRRRSDQERERARGIPVTYVPARNTIFLSLALAWGETLSCKDIFIGVNHVDSSGYPDCRPEYIKSFERMADLATKIGTEGKQKIRIRAPLIRMRKSDIIRTGAKLGVDFGMTSSCYEPSVKGRACGACDSCLLRLKGFREAGMKDPVPYVRQKSLAER